MRFKPEAVVVRSFAGARLKRAGFRHCSGFHQYRWRPTTVIDEVPAVDRSEILHRARPGGPDECGPGSHQHLLGAAVRPRLSDSCLQLVAVLREVCRGLSSSRRDAGCQPFRARRCNPNDADHCTSVRFVLTGRRMRPEQLPADNLASFHGPVDEMPLS